MIDGAGYVELFRLVDTRAAGVAFPDLLAVPVRRDRLDEFGLADLAPRELDELRTLRDVLVRIVLGDVGSASRAADTNELLQRYRLVPHLTDDLAVHYVSERPGEIATVAARVVPQVVELLRTGDADRIGVCASTDCAAPFISSTVGRERSYCSPRCAGRERLRRHRSSKRVAPEPKS